VTSANATSTRTGRLSSEIRAVPPRLNATSLWKLLEDIEQHLLFRCPPDSTTGQKLQTARVAIFECLGHGDLAAIYHRLSAAPAASPPQGNRFLVSLLPSPPAQSEVLAARSQLSAHKLPVSERLQAIFTCIRGYFGSGQPAVALPLIIEALQISNLANLLLAHQTTLLTLLDLLNRFGEHQTVLQLALAPQLSFPAALRSARALKTFHSCLAWLGCKEFEQASHHLDRFFQEEEEEEKQQHPLDPIDPALRKQLIHLAAVSHCSKTRPDLVRARQYATLFAQ
jgi:hypothetical protein